MDALTVGAELGRLAELAAQTTGRTDAARVETRIAHALGGLGDRPALSRLVATAADAARPLPRRVAVLAELHKALAAVVGR
jgi:hypothetical protein